MPEQLPVWLNEGVEPPESLKTSGWEPGMKPSAQHMNWLLNRTYNVLKALQENGDITQIEQELSKLETKFTQHSGDKIAHITSQERTKWNTAEQTVSQNKDSWSWNGVPVSDTRGVRTTAQQYRKDGIRTFWEFKQPEDVDISTAHMLHNRGIHYVVVKTIVPWVDSSGGGITQIAYLPSGKTIQRTSIIPDVNQEVWDVWLPTDYTRSRYSNINLNNYTAAGKYQLGGAIVNGPPNQGGDWGILEVYYSGDVIIQVVRGLSNNIWTRYKTNAADWLPWEQILTTYHYNQLFQSVSNGKTAVASAISDGGVYTSPVETLANMANNIRLLYGNGLRMARGTAVGTTRIDVPAGTFGFTPKLVITRGGVLTAGYLGMFSPANNTGLLGGYYGDAFQGAAGRGGHASAAEEIMFNSSVRNGGFNVQVAPSNYYPMPGISFEWIAIG